MSNAAFPSGSSGLSPAESRAAVRDALSRGDAAIAVTGGAGAGKTALCRELAASTDDLSFSTGIFDPALDPDAVLVQLLNDFGLGAGRPADDTAPQRDTLRAAVVKFLRSLRPLGAHAVLVIDDADRVGVDVLNVLIGVAQEVGPDRAPLRLVLVGAPALLARLDEAPLDGWPGGQRPWTHVQMALDDGLVPVLPPETPFIESVETVHEPAPAAGGSRASRLPVLVLALVLVAAAAWWLTMRQADGTPDSSASTPAPASAPAPAQQPPAPASAPAAPPTAAASAAAAPATAASSSQPSATPSETSPAPSPSAPPAVSEGTAAPPGAEQYRITVASFRTAARADQVAGELKAKQIAAWTRVDATGSWHQVMLGPLASIEAAREAQRELERAGFPETQISLLPAVSPR